MFRFCKNSFKFPVTQCRFFTKQQLGKSRFEKNNYTAEQNQQLLARINDLSALELSKYISKSRANRIKALQEKDGRISNIGQLLYLDGFGQKVLDKFCDNLLSEDTERSVKEPAKRVSQYSTPKLDESTRKDLKSCLGVNVSLSCVSWAKLYLDEPMNLTDWAYNELPEKLQLSELVAVTKAICNSMPEADAYVLETPPIVLPSLPGKNVDQINVNVFRSQLVAMISLGMMYKKQENLEQESQKLFFLKQFLPARLFRTLIGTERVSVEKTVLELLQYKFEVEKGDPTLAGEIPQQLHSNKTS